MQSANGVLLLDKPGLRPGEDLKGNADAGLPTSHDMVQLARRTLRERRIGHSGTLDPFASGLLVLLVGRATRLAEYYQELPKTYIATALVGQETDTGDVTGSPVEEGDVPGSWDRTSLTGVLSEFQGTYLQTPPSFSAKRIRGVRAHELARAGKEVKLEPVPVQIHEIDLLEWSQPSEFTLRVRCGAGTYIRTLVQDVARRLGTRACLAQLRRHALGGLSVDQAWTPDKLQEAGGWREGDSACLSAGDGLDWPRLNCEADQARRLGQGQIVEFMPDAHCPLQEGDFILGQTTKGGTMGVLTCLEGSSPEKVRCKAVKWLEPTQ